MQSNKKKKHAKNHNSLDTYSTKREWDTTQGKKLLDPQIVDYYLYNDLDITEYYDSIKLYSYNWKNGNKVNGYNLNNEMKAKKEK